MLTEQQYNDAYNRGFYDAEHDRRPIFRKVRDGSIIATADDPMSDNWCNDKRAAYLEGFTDAENDMAQQPDEVRAALYERDPR